MFAVAQFYVVFAGYLYGQSLPVSAHPVRRYFRRDGRMWLPLSVFVSHAAADGYHTCRLINDIQEIAARPELWPEGPETGDPAGGRGKR